MYKQYGYENAKQQQQKNTVPDLRRQKLNVTI